MCHLLLMACRLHAPSPFRGHNIGVRLIEEFLAKSRTTRCSDFADACDKLAKVGFKMFLNVTATVTDWNVNKTECSLVRAWVHAVRAGHSSAATDHRGQPNDRVCGAA